MRPSTAHRAILLALSGARIALAQDVTSSDLVEQPSPTDTDSVPEISAPVPDEPVTDTVVEDLPSVTEPADPSPTFTDSSSEIQTDILSVETTMTIPSSSTSDESSETPTEASETPTASSDIGDDNEITLVTDPSLLKNSTDQFVPVEITSQNRLAEQVVNKPVTQLTEDRAKEIAVLEGSLFHDFVESAPAPADEGMLSIALNTSECDTKLEKRVWPFKDYKDVKKCIPIRSLEFDVHYNFILPTTYGSIPPDLWRRVGSNHALLTQIYGPLGITFTLRTARNWWPPTSGSNSNWTTVAKREERLQRWQMQSHQGDKTALNVWMVPGLAGVETNGISMSLLGYATFPDDVDIRGKTDGVVLTQETMDEFVEGTSRGSTLIHETGHWLGLYHTFGEVVSDPSLDCKFGDGLLQSTHTRGHEDSVFECIQVPCGQTETRRIHNWMSYSECPGGPGATRGFTTDQKAAMFARSIVSRRGIRNAECNPSDPGGNVSKRSTMQDLVDGKCPAVQEAVDELQNYQNEAVDESQAGPEVKDDGGSDGSGGGEQDDAAMHMRILSSLGLGVTATAVLFLIL